MRRALTLTVGILAGVLAISVSTPASAQSTRRIYVHVVGEDGMPVTDLAFADVQVLENGVPQKITRLALSNHPMRIAVLVDTSAGSLLELTDLRAALASFFDAVPPPHQILFVTTGAQVRVLVQPTSDRKKLKDTANGLFTDTGGGTGTFLYEALDEIDGRFMKKPGDTVPLFVIVSGDGMESSPGFDQKVFNEFTRSLQLRDVGVYGVVLSRGTIQTPGAIALHLAQTTGGHVDVVGSSLQLTDKLKALAAMIVDNDQKMSSWYELDFASTSKNDRPVITVQISARPGVKTDLVATRHAP